MCSSVCLGQTLARKQCKSLGQGVGLVRYNYMIGERCFIWLKYGWKIAEGAHALATTRWRRLYRPWG